ncbi:protein transport protein SEC61 subunit alpha, putative [Trypanosoma equiperdum]|uniref:Pretranslocation protein, alpha subunit, putative n=4 Tax=Trypanozoon TaxID=39700 RepID=Q385E6_TRYB2|nr:SEC61-like (pretranslocation process) protein,putative [Trypanosoma brucei gambiense DAL972]XP_828697.1 pretranslocation protein subunit alpha [Trypanosoma brucei brucei TREU927]RHW67211.1 protein transport protein SEC61 subunit alpha [Trypanosoma brucei equiperdum]SCU70725.1 protein transport protein SEC61 subunit alpha, putative [Trypanosoma equiperdum]EAN79585.1 pretranslocation protein, alpha subunit, putative [Trypanosoma brucei brucei TREU927]CBH17585.1 SEC61-like (pretranslocation pr|eukprot:XP_011779849.1 SEC61-like (pretranslocation process) protein,putative [Trypanosoma brucei gambiense DAL972]
MTDILMKMSPILAFLPEVATPLRVVPIRERIMWTFVALFIFLVCCQVPVFGARPGQASDPFYWMRVVLASNKGTLMELGISPIVTASLVMELLVGVRIISYDINNKRERAVYEGVQKIVALFITIVEATAYVSSGMYGDVREIGVFMCGLIVLQLTFATMVCILLDELLQNGWGLGAGTSLFIATNICDTIIWKCFSPSTINTGRGSEFEGAIIAFFHLLVTRTDKVRALKEAFYRPQLPNLTNVFATVLLFAVVVFLQGFRVPLMTKSRNAAADRQPYIIKLFYTSNMPIILQTSVVSNINFFSQILSRRFGQFNFLINLLGRWESRAYSQSGQMYPVGGLAYYLTAPSTFYDMINDPVHAVLYIVFILFSCATFSKLWVAISHTGPRDVAKRLVSEGRWLAQARESEEDMARLLEKYIPVAASFGGLCVGALTLFADFLGAIGSGTGVLLSVTMINQYYDILREEGEDLGYNFIKRKVA